MKFRVIDFAFETQSHILRASHLVNARIAPVFLITFFSEQKSESIQCSVSLHVECVLAIIHHIICDNSAILPEGHYR